MNKLTVLLFSASVLLLQACNSEKIADINGEFEDTQEKIHGLVSYDGAGKLGFQFINMPQCSGSVSLPKGSEHMTCFKGVSRDITIACRGEDTAGIYYTGTLRGRLTMDTCYGGHVQGVATGSTWSLVKKTRKFHFIITGITH